MDSESLVNDRMAQDGLKLLRTLTECHFPFDGAGWGKGHRWILYISTPKVDELGKLAAYGEFLPILDRLDDVWITSSDITLVGRKHPIADDIRTVHSMKSMVGRWYGGHPFGGTPFSEMYVYPTNAVSEPASV